MEIAVVINVHSKPNVVMDTIESIRHYMTDDILLVIDGASTDFKKLELPVKKLEGFRHNCPRAPYRNVALGLQTVSEVYPNADWYCYLEYDCLVTSKRFLPNLQLADEKNIWMMGSDGRLDDKTMPLVSALIGSEFKSIYYLLGACQFFSKKFMTKLNEIDYFNRFLSVTNGFSDGFFPAYTGYDISEHMYPSLARHFGGNVGVFATYDMQAGRWHGSHKVFPIRWKPELDPVTENFPEASIMHPLKSYDHPIRVYHRERRRDAIRAT